MNRYHIQGFFIGLALIASVPLVAFAARTAAPVLTGLFTSATLSVNIPTPVLALGNSTTTGSVYSNGGNTMYFQVTALDGVGETMGSNLVGTSTVNEAHGWQLTWNPVQGASGYRIYFSTSTPQTLTQYFTATTTDRYTFTSTSSPTFVSGPSVFTDAYVINLARAGTSWLNGGKVAVGTTSPSVGQVTVASSTAPQISLIDINGAFGWNLRATNGGTLYVATSTKTATSTGPAPLAINRNGSVALSSTTLDAMLTLGTLGSTNGSTTVSTGKIQFDGYNSAGGRICVFFVTATLTVEAGACNL